MYARSGRLFGAVLGALVPLLVLICAAEGLQYVFVQIVDVSANGKVVMVRGDEPLDGDGFYRQLPYDKLKGMIAKRAMEQGVHLPKEYYLIDISLIGQEDWEKQDLKREQSYFASEATKHEGEVINWLLTGDADSDPLAMKSYDRAVKAVKIQSWQHDDLPKRVTDLRALFISRAEQPGSTVIYIHCEHGMDRTGELVSAYQMTYLDLPFARAQAKSDRLGPRAMQPQYHNALQWYCYYLEYVKGMKSLQCGHKDNAYVYRSRRS